MINIGHIIYLVAVFVFLGGLYMTLSGKSYIRKIIGLGIFQNSILIFYIAIGKVRGGIMPIDIGPEHSYSSPVPHVLMLTAIVVGFATLCVGLALAIKIERGKNAGS